MSVEVAYDIWSELKRYMSSVDRAEAADTLVSVLIDNDYDADEIKSAFKDDKDIRDVLQSYLEDSDSEEDLDEDEELDDY